jgi:signal transduction histidine kinase
LGKTIALGEGITGYVAKSKTPLLVRNVANAERLLPRNGSVSPGSFMSCPVMEASSALAVIHVTGKKADRSFTTRDLKRLKELAEYCREHIRELLAAPPLLFCPEASPPLPAKVAEEIWKDNLFILRSLSKYVLVFDREFKIIYGNKENELVDFLGLSRDTDIVGKSLLDLPLDMEKSILSQKLRDLLLQGTPFSLNELKILDVDGLRIVNMFFSPFVSVGGALNGGLLIIDNDTENYQVRQRLIDAEKFSFIGSLTSMIAHEVNNPLDGVMRLINLSLEQLDRDARMKEYLEEAQKGLHRIASLVGSLLTFSRKSASLTSEFTPLNMVINEAAAMVRNRSASKDVILELELTNRNPIVRTNDFYQIMTNLLSNAFDAVASRRGRVRVKTEVDTQHLHIVVEDNGCGIPTNVQGRVFEPFWTSKRDGEGTGLGLAIVKTIVDKYEAELTLKSEDNSGTRMSLLFPLSKLNSVKSSAPCPTEEQGKKPTYS